MLQNKISQTRRMHQNAHSVPFTVVLIAVITLTQVVVISASNVPYKSDFFKEPEPWNSSGELEDEDDDYLSFMRKLIAGIITFVIVVVVLCLVLCFCCPICIIAKMRKRRGAVIRTGEGATVTRSGNTVTVTVNRPAAQPPPPTTVNTPPQVVAISNNLNRNKAYPVQESVTVVPLLQPQNPTQYPPTSQPMNIGYPPGPAFPQNFELPPPYPGLSRDSDTANLPYNPYYTGDNESPTAPPLK